MIQLFYTTPLTRRRSIVNSIGRVVEESELTFRCRVELTSVRTAGPDGEYYRDEYVIYCPPDTDIAENDRIVDGSGVYPEWTVKRVFRANGWGRHHLEVRV